MSAIDTQGLLEAGASGILFAGAEFTMGNNQFELTRSLRDAGQQAALTIAAPVARRALSGTGVAMPVSNDIMDSMMVAMGTMGVDAFLGKQMNYKRMMYAGGAAFLARKGKDLISTSSALTRVV
jgi:arginine exporter protein ArgO